MNPNAICTAIIGILVAIFAVTVAVTFVKDGGFKGIAAEWRDAIRNDN